MLETYDDRMQVATNLIFPHLRLTENLLMMATPRTVKRMVMTMWIQMRSLSPSRFEMVVCPNWSAFAHFPSPP